ncbi:hypothetical protein VTP01DRAFT_2111 [Rhizomucor pusillus]|uniref:uncharacterized protein n=1 Tax=Rhizomucor pusillus TaxID=4840 RepID=UPI0037426F6C
MNKGYGESQSYAPPPPQNAYYGQGQQSYGQQYQYPPPPPQQGGYYSQQQPMYAGYQQQPQRSNAAADTCLGW